MAAETGSSAEFNQTFTKTNCTLLLRVKKALRRQVASTSEGEENRMRSRPLYVTVRFAKKCLTSALFTAAGMKAKAFIFLSETLKFLSFGYRPFVGRRVGPHQPIALYVGSTSSKTITSTLLLQEVR